VHARTAIYAGSANRGKHNDFQNFKTIMCGYILVEAVTGKKGDILHVT
jgi:hypothetical protein